MKTFFTLALLGVATAVHALPTPVAGRPDQPFQIDQPLHFGDPPEKPKDKFDNSHVNYAWGELASRLSFGVISIFGKKRDLNEAPEATVEKRDGILGFGDMPIAKMLSSWTLGVVNY